MRPPTPVSFIARKIATIAGRIANDPLDDHQFNELLVELEKEMTALQVVLALRQEASR